MPSRRAASDRARAREERLRRVEDDGCGDQEAEPAEELVRRAIRRVDRAQVQRPGEHHALHRAEPRHEQTLERGARFAAPPVVERARIERQRAVTRSRRGFEHCRQRGLGRSPDHSRAPGDGVDRRLDDARQRGERTLDQPDAPGAAHALDEQHRLAVAARRARARHGGRSHVDATHRARDPRPAWARVRCAVGNSRRDRAARSTPRQRDNPRSKPCANRRGREPRRRR